MIFVDSHVHFYPCYSFSQFIESATSHIRLAQGTLQASSIDGCLLLTEREDCDFYSELLSGKFGPPQVVEPGCAKVDAEIPLFVFAGRQLVTRERVEVLSLFSNDRPSERLSLGETVEFVESRGGIAVLPWSFGKWWGHRGTLLASFLSQARNKPLLGDIPLRTAIGTPSLMRGRRVIAGSDPLPFFGEEKRVGQLLTVYHATLDHSQPVASLKSIVSAHEAQIVGKRDTLVEATKRLVSLKIKGI